MKNSTAKKLRQIPEAYLLVGVGAFTFKRMARVEILCLRRAIWVNLAGVELSKNARRKLVRYKAGRLPRELEENVFSICAKAVRRFLAS